MKRSNLTSLLKETHFFFLIAGMSNKSTNVPHNIVYPAVSADSLKTATPTHSEQALIYLLPA